jgi:hypothetical protein
VERQIAATSLIEVASAIRHLQWFSFELASLNVKFIRIDVTVYHQADVVL